MPECGEVFKYLKVTVATISNININIMGSESMPPTWSITV